VRYRHPLRADYICGAFFERKRLIGRENAAGTAVANTNS
jgi:hypothetical protein